MKPLLRGHIHQAAFVIACGACALLISQSHGSRELTANIIYSLSLIGLYGVSALYHTPLWGHRAYRLMRRIDYAAIFILIAGSATPICLFGVRGKLGIELTSLIWMVAMAGMLIAVFWLHAPKWVRAVLYITAGWFVIPYFPQIKSSLGETDLWLLVMGGIIYTVGALIYACKRPDPIPHIFGYHEIFHVLVVIASAMHFSVIYSLTT
jgi:hemolysin III